MIDIHCHILPMVDDGSQSVEESLQMLISAYEDGTDEIILTPHLAYAYGFDNPYAKISELFSQFKYIVEQERIPIQLYLGTEFLFSSKDTFLSHLDEITKMNQTSYLLMEFFFNIDASFVLEAIDCVTRQELRPIIAHPERYDCIQVDPELSLEIHQRGALLQLNKGSILGEFGRRVMNAAYALLDQHAYDFVGSDAHHLDHRTPDMYEAYIRILNLYGERYTKYLFELNASRMLQNLELKEGIE